MRYFPMFMDIADKPVLVVGGGEVASRKVEALVKAGAKITLISPELTPYLLALYKDQKCEWIQEKYHKNKLKHTYCQVWATTDDTDLNHTIYRDAHELNLLVNVVDDQPYCDFITPSMISRGRIQIAISSGGASPVLVRNARQSIESVLPQNMDLLAEFAAQKRESIKQELPSVELRRFFWEQFFSSRGVKEATDSETLESYYSELLEAQQPFAPDCTLIFYGDDAELLPIKATQYMQQADLILYDQHCAPLYLELSRRDAEKKIFTSLAQLKNLLTDSFHNNERVCVFVSERDKESFLDVVVANRCFFCAVMS